MALQPEQIAVISELLRLWRPGLQELMNRCGEDQRRLFPGLTAFMGMQLTLWPLWLKGLENAGMRLEPDDQDFQLHDEELHMLPWFCIFQPLSDIAGWILVRGFGLPDTARTHSDLNDPQIARILSMLDTRGRTLVYGPAQEFLTARGALNEEQAKAIGNEVLSPQERLMMKDYGYLYRLTLPTAYVDQLQEDWPEWRRSAEPLSGLLAGLAEEQVHLGRDAVQAKTAFLRLADQLWCLLQSEGLIYCGPFIPSRTARNSLSFYFRRRKDPEHFSGLLLLLGNHQNLWRVMQEGRRVAEADISS